VVVAEKTRKKQIDPALIVASFDDDEIALARYLRDDPVAFCRHVLQVRPHRKQVEVLTSPLERQSSLLPWGRQFGKSTVIRWYLAWKLFSSRGYTAYVMSPSGEQSAKFFERLLDVFEQSAYLRTYATWKVSGRTLHVGGDEWGASVEWLKVGLDASNVRGRTITDGNGLVVYDEAASFLYPEQIIGVTLPFCATGGGAVYLSSPGEIGSYFHALYEDFKAQERLARERGETPRHRVYEADWRDVDHLSAEFVAEQERSLTAQGRRWFFEREYLGRWVRTEGAFFNASDVKLCHVRDLPQGGSADTWIYSLDPGLDKSPAVLIVARWNPVLRRLEIGELISLVRDGNRYVRQGSERIAGYPDLLDLILELRRTRPIHRLYYDPGIEQTLSEMLGNRFGVATEPVRVGGYAAKLTALQDLQRALSAQRIVWQDHRITAQLLGFSAPVNPLTGRHDFPTSDADIVVALCQLARYLGQRVETPWAFEAVTRKGATW